MFALKCNTKQLTHQGRGAHREAAPNQNPPHGFGGTGTAHPRRCLTQHQQGHHGGEVQPQAHVGHGA